MSSAPHPVTEAERLAALEAYAVLDTPAEKAYDDITFIASQICDTPIALISLVDRERQWFKSRVGIDAEQTHRDQAFCAHAILDPEHVLVVEDTLEDTRFADNQFVRSDPGFRFYAGAPLVSADGHAIGTLCVIDSKPRELTETQAATLQALSRQVMTQLELSRTVKRLQTSKTALESANAELQESQREVIESRNELVEMVGVLEGQADVIERDLKRAEVIQRSLLPHHAPEMQGFSVKTYYHPGRNIGGDLYDVVGIGERYLAFVIADAAGHGVSAAMLSVLFKNRLRLVDDDGLPLRPSEALGTLNSTLREDLTTPGVFVTAAFCLLDTDSRELVVSSAGHPPLVVVRAGGSVEALEHTGPALGLYPEADYGEHHLVLADGDSLLMFTDGLLDLAKTPPSPARLAAAVIDLRGSDHMLEALVAEIATEVDPSDRDDVTVVLLDGSPGVNSFVEATEWLPTRGAADGVVIDGEVSGEALKALEPTLEVAEDEHTTFLLLSGHVSWVFGEALLRVATEALDAGHGVVIDLGACEHLDSTMLGTLHELVDRSVSSGQKLSLQKASATLEAAFAELSMADVQGAVAADAMAVPVSRQRVELPVTDVRRQQQHLLKAHEILARLSDGNREQFKGVIESLKSEDG